jgi:RND family efflux transporter MFP subunit
MAGSRRLRNGLWVATAVLVLGGSLLFVTAPEPQAEVSAEGAQGAVLQLAVLEVEARPLARRVRKTGILEARRQLELISETRGRIVELGAGELDRVTEGQLLVRVDPILAEVAVERAEAAVERAEGELEFAGHEQERWEQLAEREAGSLSRRDDTLKAERVARANLREVRAGLAEARDQLAKKTIVAPFPGVLRDLPVEVGEYLQEGKHVGELLDVETVRLVVGLSDREIVEVAAGEEVEVQVEALEGRALVGSVLRVGAAADPLTKKFPVEVEIRNPGGHLLPGMVASVELSLGEPAPAMLVPRDATLEQHGLRFVYVLERADEGATSSSGRPVYRASRRRIEVRELPSHPADFVVVGGLAPRDRIAASRIRELRDGSLVRGRAGEAG